MQSMVNIRIKTPESEECHNLCVPNDTTVDHLKTLAAGFSGIPIDEISLVFCGKEMKDGSISNYNISDGQTIQVFPKKLGVENQSGVPQHEDSSQEVEIHFHSIAIPEFESNESSLQESIDRLNSLFSKLSMTTAVLQESMANDRDIQDELALLVNQLNEFAPQMLITSGKISETYLNQQTHGATSNNPRVFTQSFTNGAGIFQGLQSILEDSARF